MGSRIGGKMTSTVRVTPGISRYKVVWRVEEVSTELREIHARRRSNMEIGMPVRKDHILQGVIRKDPLKFRKEKLTALEARGQMLVFDVKQVRRKTLDGNYPHQFFSN